MAGALPGQGHPPPPAPRGGRRALSRVLHRSRPHAADRLHGATQYSASSETKSRGNPTLKTWRQEVLLSHKEISTKEKKISNSFTHQMKQTTAKKNCNSQVVKCRRTPKRWIILPSREHQSSQLAM